MTFSVLAGRKRAMGVTGGMEMGTVREGTTGRVVSLLPRVWAVASAEPAPATADAKGPAGAKARLPVPKAEVAFYRKYTEAMVRRYLQLTMEAGRVPSIIGRPVLGGKASSYRIHGFDDAVNFRLDMERCLRKLEPEQREVIRRVTMQEYTQGEAAALLGICLRTCVQRYARAVDRLTELLLEYKLLEPMKGLSRGEI